MFIIGDIQGGDVICRQQPYYSTSAKQISRMCNVGPELLLRPLFGKCQRLIMQEVMDQVADNNTNYLQIFRKIRRKKMNCKLTFEFEIQEVT